MFLRAKIRRKDGKEHRTFSITADAPALHNAESPRAGCAASRAVSGRDQRFAGACVAQVDRGDRGEGAACKDAVAVSRRSLRGTHRRWLDCSTEAQGDAVVPAADIRELLAGLDAVAGIAAGPLLEGPPARQPRGHALGRGAVCSGGLSSSVAGQRMAAAPRMVRQKRACRSLGLGCEPWRDQYALSLSRPAAGAQA